MVGTNIVLHKIEREMQGPQKMLEACRSPNTMSAVSPGNGDDAGPLPPHCPTCRTADGTIRTDHVCYSNKACPHYSKSTKHVAIDSLKLPRPGDNDDQYTPFAIECSVVINMDKLLQVLDLNPYILSVV